MTLRASAELLLRTLAGNPAATFRDGQWEAIEQLVVHRRRALVVQRTGWGKSAVYFLATRLLRDAGAGPTLLVSPLLALMRNQVAAAARMGVQAETIHSENRDQWEDIEKRVRAGEIDILLISPERLNNPRFRADVLPDLARTVGLLVVDEAHCISDWGHDFRPDYRRIARVLGSLPPGAPVLCTTATANDRVVDDIVDQLGDDLVVIRGPLERESLALGVVDLPSPAERLAWLATVIPTLPGSGIVYCLTVRDTKRVAGWLTRKGFDAVAYSGDSEHDDRLLFEERLLGNEVKVVVATSALGMGFDKPDLCFVVHYQSPGSPIAYYQQVGRAGRGVDHAVGVLLRGTEDTDIQDYFIRTAFPPRPQAEQVVALLEDAPAPVGIGEIEQAVNARRSRVDGMLKVLEVEGAVERMGSKWQRTSQPWSYDEERVERVTALRRAEQGAMVEYAGTAGCRMAFLRQALDDRSPKPCGRCDRCTGATWHLPLAPGVVAEAVRYVRSQEEVVEPRLRWPAGLGTPSGAIAVGQRVEPGRAVGVFGDGGWGSVVARARAGGAAYPDELVEAALSVVARWEPMPAPTWVTSVPVGSGDTRVADAARRLAEALGLPFRDVVGRTRVSRPQREMQNSAQQVRNVFGAFEVRERPPPGPVLLVDDVVDSRWTLTVVGSVLRQAGTEAVHPLALAWAGPS